MKRKFVEETISEIKEFCTVTVPAMAAQINDPTAYLMNQRAALNNLIIEAMLGCEITVGATEKENKVKFNHHLPSMAQVREVVNIVDDFIANVENPMLAALINAGQAESDDLAIPQEFELKIGDEVQRVTMIDKVSNKKLKSEIFERRLMQTVKMTGKDVLALAALGQEARKRSCRNKMLIIGGIQILLLGGLTAALIVRKVTKKHEDDNMENIDVSAEDVPEVDLSDADVDVPLPGDEVPQVELEEIA